MIIYKYVLDNDINTVEIEDKIKRFLDVQIQNGQIVVWAELNDECEVKKYKVIGLGTGWDLKTDAKLNYIATIQENEYVWHYYWMEVI